MSVLVGASAAEITSSNRPSHHVHLTCLQSSLFNILLPVTARRHAGEGRSLVLNQPPGKKKHQSQYSSVILKRYFDIRTGRKGGRFGRVQEVPAASQDSLANYNAWGSMEPCLPSMLWLGSPRQVTDRWWNTQSSSRFLCIRFIATTLGSYFHTDIGTYFQRDYPMFHLYYPIKT